MKRCFKVIAFILIVALLSSLLKFVLSPSSYLRVVLHDVQDESVNYDMIILGQSLGETSVDPYKLQEVMGVSTYNLCRQVVTVKDLYYLMKEANYHNDMKIAVLYIDPSYWIDTKESYYGDSYIFPHLKNPKNKIEYFFNYCMNSDYRVMFFRYTVYGTGDLKNSITKIKQKLSSEYRAFSMNAVSDKNDGAEYRGRGFLYCTRHYGIEGSKVGWNQDEIEVEAVQSFEKMADYCKQNKITFIVVNAPYPSGRNSREDLKDMRDYFCKLAKSNGAFYLDGNFISPEYLSYDENSFSDSEGHMIGEFATEYSGVLGEIMKKYLQGEDTSTFFVDD